ncbi:MAG: undecaprenyl-phosphate glucose phosphotransferase [Hydrogenophilaceae bacterium]|nr:undecaprenyl-phosphate glucose phosphotransferase [Hydrogenophilaceae bacterium]
MAVIVLFAANAYYDEAIDGPEILFSIILFSMLYPGSMALHDKARSYLREILMQWLPTVGILFLLGYGTHYLHLFDDDALKAWALGVPIVWLASHLLLPQVWPGLYAMEGVRRAVIIGANDIGCRLAEQFCLNHYLGVQFLGFFDDRSLERLGEIRHGRLLGRLGGVAEYIQQSKADAIFIALPMASQPRILKLLDDLKDSTGSIYFVPDIFVTDLIQARVDEIGGMPVVAVCETPFYGINGLVKRASDVVVAGSILTLIAPLMLAISVAVKLSSPGPVLFKQRRYGLDGQEIIVYKFRSMTVCEDGPVIEQAKKEDKRVTRIGAVLRRTSLDELPQFINVLQGRMSVVGPRPHAVAHNELYRKLVKGYMVRHKVKPGITGLAQVSGCRGETDTVEKMQKRIEYDLEYLRRWSLHLDLEIILRTILLVIRDRQAY